MGHGGGVAYIYLFIFHLPCKPIWAAEQASFAERNSQETSINRTTPSSFLANRAQNPWRLFGKSQEFLSLRLLKYASDFRENPVDVS
jgi:hypothetical protein